ncbi:hypothetical protein ACFVRR_04030, partial [Gottfriedia sp. NPDC057948]|uniref:hypothetical protein n=1 Tax=Gottfriedia sp. NPDC057948 TaxID=3346287 RepID=UPI0036DC4AC3
MVMKQETSKDVCCKEEKELMENNHQFFIQYKKTNLHFKRFVFRVLKNNLVNRSKHIILEKISFVGKLLLQGG